MCKWRLSERPEYDWTLALAYLSTWRNLWLLNIEQEPRDRQNVCDADYNMIVPFLMFQTKKI